MSDLTLSFSDELVEALSERIADAVFDRLDQSSSAGPTPYLDVNGAARYLACETHRVYDLVHQGRIRVARDGRRLLFRREWLDEGVQGDSFES